MCMVYGTTECYHKINCELTDTEIQCGINEYQATNLEAVDYWKEEPGVICRRQQQTHRSIDTKNASLGIAIMLEIKL